MKEFKEDKLEMQQKIADIIKDFNNKYDVIVSDVNVCYIGVYMDSQYLKVEVDVKL